MSIARSNSLGQLTTTVSNTGQLAGMRNRIINGDMRVSQRGTAFASGAVQYGLDRFQFYRGGAVAGATLTAGTFASVLPFGFFNGALAQRNSGDTSTATIVLATSFETQTIRDLAGKTITLSFLGFCNGAAIGATTANIVYGTGTDGSLGVGFTGSVTAGGVTLSSSSAWVKQSVTVTLPSTATQLGVSFGYSPTGTAGANDYFVITGLQLELGTVATPFEQRPYGLELSLCQRYCYVQASIAGSRLNLGAGGVSSSTGGIITGSFPVAMRSIPTQVFVGANQFRILGLNNGSPVTVSAVDANLTSYSIGFTGTALTAGSGVIIQTVDSPSPSPSVTFLAEL
jgi:hypothetical protein